MKKDIKNIILKILNEIACKNTGSCQINLQSESAQIMIAEKITEGVDPYVRDLVEDIVIGMDEVSKAFGGEKNG